VFGIIGFEAAVPLGEEARNPKRAIPIAVFAYVIYSWLAAGVLVLIYFLATDRSRIARTGLVFEQPDVQVSESGGWSGVSAARLAAGR
jgi:hypothetical protein